MFFRTLIFVIYCDLCFFLRLSTQTKKVAGTKRLKMELIFLLIIAVLLPLLVQNREVNTINKTQGWVLLIAGVVSFSVAAITVLVGIV